MTALGQLMLLMLLLECRNPNQQHTEAGKHHTSHNVLAVVDFDLKFTYVLAGWEGSAHDASILNDSLNRPDRIQLSEGKFYLGDAGYACWSGILPPPSSRKPGII
jgi:hypothetical protein